VFFLSCKANAKAKSCKDGTWPALFEIFVLFYVFFVLFYVFFVLFYVFFVLFYVFLCCSMYCLSCDVLCIVCVYMCTELLPPGGYPVAVQYIISNTEIEIGSNNFNTLIQISATRFVEKGGECFSNFCNKCLSLFHFPRQQKETLFFNRCPGRLETNERKVW